MRRRLYIEVVSNKDSHIYGTAVLTIPGGDVRLRVKEVIDLADDEIYVDGLSTVELPTMYARKRRGGYVMKKDVSGG